MQRSGIQAKEGNITRIYFDSHVAKSESKLI